MLCTPVYPFLLLLSVLLNLFLVSRPTVLRCLLEAFVFRALCLGGHVAVRLCTLSPLMHKHLWLHPGLSLQVRLQASSLFSRPAAGPTLS